MDGQSVRIFKGECRDPLTADLVRIFKRWCRDPRTVESIPILKREMQGSMMQGSMDGRIDPNFEKKMQESTDGRIDPNFKRGCRNPWTAESVKISKGNAGIHEPPILSEFKKRMQGSTNGRIGPNFQRGMKKVPDGSQPWSKVWPGGKMDFQNLNHGGKMRKTDLKWSNIDRIFYENLTGRTTFNRVVWNRQKSN